MGSARALAVIGIAGLLAAGCIAHGADLVAERLADAADLPYVDQIRPMQPLSDASGDGFVIFLRADVTDAQVADLYCKVVVPATPPEFGSFQITMLKGVTWHPPMSAPLASGEDRWFDGGTDVYAPDCHA